MHILRSLLLLILLPSFLVAAPVHRLAPPLEGPMPYVGHEISVAMGVEKGFAVWRVGGSVAEPAAVWGVPLDLAGLPTAPPRPLLAIDTGINDLAVYFADGAFRLWWQPGPSAGVRTARIHDDFTLGETTVLWGVQGVPRASNHELTLAMAQPMFEFRLQFVDVRSAEVVVDDIWATGRIEHVDAVVLSDESFAVVTAGADGVLLSRFSPEGARLGAPLTVGPPTHRVAVASDGSSVLIAWPGGNSEQPEIFAALVSRDDQLQAPAVLASGLKRVYEISAAFSDGVYTVSFAADDEERYAPDLIDLYAFRVTPTGTVAEEVTPIFVKEGNEARLSMRSAGGSHHLFFLRDGEVSRIELPTSSSLVRPDVAAVDSILSLSVAWQELPTAASDGGRWLAVWMERTANEMALRTIRLGFDGRPVGPPVTLASGIRSFAPSPKVAFNGLDYIVSWVDREALLVKRVGRDGVPIDETAIEITRNFYPYNWIGTWSWDLAGRDGVTAIAWQEGREVHAALLHANGSVSGSQRISAQTYVRDDRRYSYEGPVVSAGSGGFLVAWHEAAAYCMPTCFLSFRGEARMLSQAGVLAETVMNFELIVRSSAAAGSTHLIAFDLFGDSPGPLRLVRQGGEIQSLPVLPVSSPVTVLVSGDEYVVAYHSTSTDDPVVMRFNSDGALLRTQTIDAIALPAAVSLTGALLSVASISNAAEPFKTAREVVAQVHEPQDPPPGRRRAVRR